MGSFFSCLEHVQSIERLEYDLSPIKDKALPIIWLIGPPGSGRRTQGDLLSENLGFENIKVTQLLRLEATKETERGKIINEAIRNRLKRIPDTVVVDLIKEAMLRSCAKTKGYIINNFPKSPKQAELFVKEIGKVNMILYLDTKKQVLVERVQHKINGRLSNDTIRRKIEQCMKDIKDCLNKFDDKIEKVNTTESPDIVFSKILDVIASKINIKPNAISSETAYAEAHNSLNVLDVNQSHPLF